MEERKALQQQMQTTQIILTGLEQQLTTLEDTAVPDHLHAELTHKREELYSLQIRLAQLEGRSRAVVHNLPPREPVFVGRAQAIADCLAALDPEDRGWGVVISGMGGMGKTALAVEVAHLTHMKAWFDAYLFVSAKTTWLRDDGVRQETLSLSSLDAFIGEFARLLGYEHIVQMTEATARRQAMIEALRGRQALLIWDNLETLSAEERNRIEAFLRRLPAPNKALVTSRYQPEERVLTLQLDRLGSIEALQLLDEVARRQPRVAVALGRVSETTRLRLCEAAGGNPLALHWTLGLIARKNLQVSEALKHLQDAMRSPDLYAFLFATALQGASSNELTVLAALATFQASATPSVLAQITRLQSTAVSLALQQLTALSLVHHGPGEQYRLHPLAQTYTHTALRRPGGEGLDVVTYHRALRFWVRHAYTYGRTQYRTFRYLDDMWPNLEVTATALYALSGAPKAVQDKEAARLLIYLARCLHTFCVFRGYWDEGIHLHTWAYEVAILLGEWQQAGWRAYDAARVFCYRAETEQAMVWVERMIAATARGGTRRDWAVATSLRGQIALQRGDLDEAEQCGLEALAAFRDLGARRDQAVLLNDLGSIARKKHDAKHAQHFFRQGFELASQLNDKRLQAIITGNLGAVALDRDRLQAAHHWYKRQLALALELGRSDVKASAQTGCALVLAREGRPADALPLAEEALSIRQRLRERTLEETQQLVHHLRQQVQQQ